MADPLFGMKIFPEQYELISLFESEPVLIDTSAPWTYNRLEFTRTIGENRIECIIEPSDATLRIRWSQHGMLVIDLDLHKVHGLTVESVNGVDALIADFREGSGVSPLRVQLKPSIHVFWGTYE